MTTTSRALSFDTAAAAYAANRPSYPAALLEAVEDIAGRSLAGARVADIGAGTGIATALLHDRGAQVVAVEPGAGMAAQFRRTLPSVPLVQGDGNRLPLADDSVDFLTYGQAWHWTDPERSVPEAVRVLRDGGALALWWNTFDLAVPWAAEQDARIRRFLGAPDVSPNVLAGLPDLPGRLDFTTRHVPWTRRIPLDVHVANLGSHSAFLVLGEERTGAFLEGERDRLAELFPDGAVEERYIVTLSVAIP